MSCCKESCPECKDPGLAVSLAGSLFIWLIGFGVGVVVAC